jgi:hypothetical protein
VNTIVAQGLWIVSGLSLFVVAWVRFNKPPTNRGGTTFLLFYSGMVFYYALLMGLWLLIILLLTGSGYGLLKVGDAVNTSLKDHQQLSPAVPAVAALIITVASQFKYVRDLDTAARSFCLALAAIPREADQLAIELAYGAEFRPVDPRLIESVSREITDNVGSNAVSFANDGTMASCFTRAVALYWLFVVPSDSGTPLPFPTNAATRSAYARTMRLNEKIVEQSSKLYEAMMEHALSFFSSSARSQQTKASLKRSMHDLSYIVCSLIARHVLSQNVTASQRRKRLSRMGFDVHDHLPAFGRDQWVASILAVIVLFSAFSILLPAHQPFRVAFLYSVLVSVQLGIASLAGTIVAQRFIRNGESRGTRFPPLAELIAAGLVVIGSCAALRIGWPLIPNLINTGSFGLSDSIDLFTQRWAFVLTPFICTISIGLLCSYLGASNRAVGQLAVLGGVFNGLAFVLGGFLISNLVPEELLLDLDPRAGVAKLILMGIIGAAGTVVGGIVLATFPRSIRTVSATSGVNGDPTVTAPASLPVLEDPTSRAMERTVTPVETTAARELGGYSRANVEELVGRYVCFRPTFSSPDVITAYLVVISWDEKRACLIFEEQDRPDSRYTQKGLVYLPDGKPFLSLVTMDKGSVRSIMVARPEEGLSRGMIMTLANPGGTHFIPTTAPIVLRRLGEVVPQLGFVHRHSPDYDLYRMQLRSVAPDFGMFANVVAASAPTTAGKRSAVRLSLVERAGA